MGLQATQSPPDRVLAAELQPVQPPVAQCLPEQLFRRGFALPQIAGGGNIVAALAAMRRAHGESFA